MKGQKSNVRRQNEMWDMRCKYKILIFNLDFRVYFVSRR